MAGASVEIAKKFIESNKLEEKMQQLRDNAELCEEYTGSFTIIRNERDKVMSDRQLKSGRYTHNAHSNRKRTVAYNDVETANSQHANDFTEHFQKAAGELGIKDPLAIMHMSALFKSEKSAELVSPYSLANNGRNKS